MQEILLLLWICYAAHNSYKHWIFCKLQLDQVITNTKSLFTSRQGQIASLLIEIQVDPTAQGALGVTKFLRVKKLTCDAF